MIDRKRIFALVLTVLLAFSVSACSEKSPETEVAQAMQKIAKAESMTSAIDVDMEVTVGDHVSAQENRANSTVVYTPFQAQIQNVTNVGGPQEMAIDTYAKEKGENVTVYMQYDSQWMKQNISKEKFLDSFQMYDTKENIQMVMKAVPTWTRVSEKDKIATLTGTIEAEKLYNILEGTRILQMIGMTGLTEDYYKGVPDLKVTLKIDESTKMPKSFSADFSPVLQVLMENVMKNFKDAEKPEDASKIDVNKYLVTVECSDFNKTSDISVPEEALKTAVDFEQQMKAYQESQQENTKEDTSETPKTTTPETTENTTE